MSSDPQITPLRPVPIHGDGPYTDTVLPAIAALTFNGSRPAVLYLQQVSRGRRRGKRRFWLTELRSVLDRAEALKFPTHRKESRS